MKYAARRITAPLLGLLALLAGILPAGQAAAASSAQVLAVY